MEKLDIILLAGQSNADGRGIGEVTHPYAPDSRILMMTDNANPRFQNEDGRVYLHLDSPASNIVAIAEEPPEKNGNFALAFATRYAQTYLESDRKILIVNAAVGGTGFARPEWGVGRVLHNRLIGMLEEALSYNPENRVVAFLWHQGEHDSFENADWDPEKRYTTHKANLTATINDIYSRFDLNSVPFIAGGFCDEWYLAHKEACDAVLKAIRECCAQRGSFVETAGLLSNNQKTGNDDTIHFCKESLHILGNKYFDEYAAICSK
jgi:hypothetical protein